MRSALISTVALLMMTTTAGANGTHKKRKPSELDATITCRSPSGKQSLRVLAEDMKGWLVRASDGASIVAQTLRVVEIVSANQSTRTATVRMTSQQGDQMTEQVKFAALNAVGFADQPRIIRLGDCSRMDITLHSPASEPDDGSVTKK